MKAHASPHGFIETHMDQVTMYIFRSIQGESPPKKILQEIFAEGKEKREIPSRATYGQVRWVARSFRPNFIPMKVSLPEKQWILQQCEAYGYHNLPLGKAPPRRVMKTILICGFDARKISTDMTFEKLRNIARNFRN